MFSLTKINYLYFGLGYIFPQDIMFGYLTIFQVDARNGRE